MPAKVLSTCGGIVYIVAAADQIVYFSLTQQNTIDLTSNGATIMIVLKYDMHYKPSFYLLHNYHSHCFSFRSSYINDKLL